MPNPTSQDFSGHAKYEDLMSGEVDMLLDSWEGIGFLVDIQTHDARNNEEGVIVYNVDLQIVGVRPQIEES